MRQWPQKMRRLRAHPARGADLREVGREVTIMSKRGRKRRDRKKKPANHGKRPLS